MESSRKNITGSDVVVCWHDEMRKQGLRRRPARKGGKFGNDTIRPEAGQQFQLGAARGFGPLVREVHDFALCKTIDRTMRIFDEAFEVFGMPMVAASLLVDAVHALLHDRPLAVVGHEESVQIEIETVLNSGAVDLGDKPARARQQGTVKTDAFAQEAQFIRRFPRMLASAAADMNPQFTRERT